MKLADESSDVSDRGGRPCLKQTREKRTAMSVDNKDYMIKVKMGWAETKPYFTRSARLRECWCCCARTAISASETSLGARFEVKRRHRAIEAAAHGTRGSQQNAADLARMFFIAASRRPG